MTETSHDQSSGVGVTYEDRLPLRCEKRAAPVAREEQLRFDVGNEAVLRSIQLLGDLFAPDNVDEAAGTTELFRIEQKLNIMIELVSTLYARQEGVPSPVPLRLASGYVEWDTHERLVQNDALLVEIYLSSRFPKPFAVGATVEAVEERGDVRRIRAAFGPVSESVKDQLDKFLFRQHRRLIAVSRKTAAVKPGKQ